LRQGKDNRLLPAGFLPIDERIAIADALGANHELAEDVAPVEIGDDPTTAPAAATPSRTVSRSRNSPAAPPRSAQRSIIRRPAPLSAGPLLHLTQR
jgi:hypothetical protein